MVVVVASAGGGEGEGVTGRSAGGWDDTLTPRRKGNLDREPSYRCPAPAGNPLDGGVEALDRGGWGGCEYDLLAGQEDARRFGVDLSVEKEDGGEGGGLQHGRTDFIVPRIRLTKLNLLYQGEPSQSIFKDNLVLSMKFSFQWHCLDSM